MKPVLRPQQRAGSPQARTPCLSTSVPPRTGRGWLREQQHVRPSSPFPDPEAWSRED